MADADQFAEEEEHHCLHQLHDEEREKKQRVSSVKEKEKTKIRERHRRSITTKILTGLRKHGNYNLPPRADINDVLKALATEAGWIVEADGTTYRNPALQPLTSGGLGRSSMPQQLGLTINASHAPGTLTPVSVTPTPSSSSLNSLGGFNCAPPHICTDPIDLTGGECSTTASPRYISNSAMGLLNLSTSHLLPAAADGLSNIQFGSSVFLGGTIPHEYMLNDENDILGIRDDTTAAGYFPGDMIEHRDMLPGQSPVETPTSSLTTVRLPSNNLSPYSGLCSAQLSPIAYSARNGMPASMLYGQHQPFVQESRASNHSTPIGSPQPMGLSSNIMYIQQPPFLQESRASNQNTPIGSPQPHGGIF